MRKSSLFPGALSRGHELESWPPNKQKILTVVSCRKDKILLSPEYSLGVSTTAYLIHQLLYSITYTVTGPAAAFLMFHIPSEAYFVRFLMLLYVWKQGNPFLWPRLESLGA